MHTDESVFGLLDSTSERDLDAFLSSCEDDPLPTPTPAGVLAESIGVIWSRVRIRAFRLADRRNIEVPDSIDPAFAARLVPEPPEPMSAQCDTDDWALLDSLPDSARSQLEVFYAYQYERQELLMSPTELVSVLCRQFLGQLEATRRRRRARHLVRTCPAAEAAHACLGLEGESVLFEQVLERHTFPAEASDSEVEDVSWSVRASDLSASRERYRQRVRYDTAAFQVYAEAAPGLHSKEIPDVARIEFAGPGRPNGYLLPFYVPQRNGADHVHGYDHSIRFVTDHAKALVPEQYAAASEAYEDVASGRAHLVLVADTKRLALGEDSSQQDTGEAPRWLVNALDRVRDHPFNDGHGGREGPFDEHRDWNPFVDPN
jgi:hypothetical protein